MLGALSEQESLIWIKLSSADANDFVAQGNRLAEAVNKTLKATLLPQALPFAYGIEVLKSHLPLIGSLHIALSNADLSPLFAESLLSLNSKYAKVLLDFNTTASFLSKDVIAKSLYLSPDKLRLTKEEALGLARAQLSEEISHNLWLSSAGAYGTFITGVQRLTGQQVSTIPDPQGKLRAADEEVAVSPEALFAVLKRLGRYVEALDLAAMTLPEQVAELLPVAGPVYQEQGLFGRLHLLLESLDERYQQHEEVMSWRLLAAANLGKQQDILPQVAEFLESHEAPSLRARHVAAIADPERAFSEAKRAASAASTPLTLFQYGRVHPDANEGVAMLRKSIQLAEHQDNSYAVSRAANSLAERLIHLGHYEDAANWLEWALRNFDQHGLKDGQRRLMLVNNWAYARILIGQTTGLETMLLETQQHLESALPLLAVLFKSTLADLELVLGNLSAAEKLAQANLLESPRLITGYYTVPLVRILLEKGDVQTALSEARRSVTLTAAEADVYHFPSLLALGMALSFADPRAAFEPLNTVMTHPKLGSQQRTMAALHLLFANSQREQVRDALPQDVQIQFKDLAPTGLKLFSGPEHAFTSIWAQILGEDALLNIRVLGAKEVWFEGQPLQVSLQMVEILSLLALNPKGLSTESLHAKLYGDRDVKAKSLRAILSRLRQRLPISSSPYKLETSFRFDASTCENLLKSGKVREALELYKGALLEQSEAPGILEARWSLEEHLRRAALESKDAEVLVAMSQRIGDDFELWETTKQALPSGDPRLVMVKVQLDKLTRDYS